MIRTVAGVMLLLLTAVPVRSQTIEVDPRIPAYHAARGISGSASSIGSDTMNNLMALWLEVTGVEGHPGGPVGDQLLRQGEP